MPMPIGGRSHAGAVSSSPLKMRPSALEDDALSAAATTRPGSPVQAEPISVLIRVRPLTAAERGQPNVWKHDRQSIWQSAPAGPGRTTVPAQTYSFDRIFGPADSTAQIYDECVHERPCASLLANPRSSRTGRLFRKNDDHPRRRDARGDHPDVRAPGARRRERRQPEVAHK